MLRRKSKTKLLKNKYLDDSVTNHFKIIVKSSDIRTLVKTVNYFRMENEIFVIQQHRIEQHKEFEEAFKISQCNLTEYRTQLGKLSPTIIILGPRIGRIHW